MSAVELRQAAEAHWAQHGIPLTDFLARERAQGSSFPSCRDVMVELLGWAPSSETLRRWAHDDGVGDRTAARLYVSLRTVTTADEPYAKPTLVREEPGS